MRTDLDFKLYLIRHGETNRNLQSDLIGQDPGEPLNDDGKVQATKLAARFKSEKIRPDVIFTSPYKRAMETCKIVNAQWEEPITIVNELREIYQGEGLNKSRKELYTKEFKEHLEYLGMHFKFPNGESLYDVEHRAVTWIEQFMVDYSTCETPMYRKSGQSWLNQEAPLNVFVFTHGMTVKCLLHHIMKFDQALTWRINIENTSVSTLHFKDGNWFVEAINDCWHLKS